MRPLPPQGRGSDANTTADAVPALTRLVRAAIEVAPPAYTGLPVRRVATLAATFEALSGQRRQAVVPFTYVHDQATTGDDLRRMGREER